MSYEKDVQLGLCCMNMTLKIHYKVYASRKIILRTVKEKGIEELKRRILLNLEDLLKMIEWNEKNGIRVFRLSSEMFLHKTNPKVEDYGYEFAIPHLKKIAEPSRNTITELHFTLDNLMS